MSNFDKQYKKEKCLWGLKPSTIVEYLLKYKRLGKALDLGAGEGRNSLFLAEKGFDVTAVDISKEAIRKLERLALDCGVEINGFVGDIKDNDFRENYDVILSIATLHFLGEEDIKRVIEKMKVNTRKRGLNVISVFTRGNGGDFSYLFDRGELRSYYRDWEILTYKEYTSSLEKHGKDGKWHRHELASLIARNSS